MSSMPTPKNIFKDLWKWIWFMEIGLLIIWSNRNTVSEGVGSSSWTLDRGSRLNASALLWEDDGLTWLSIRTSKRSEPNVGSNLMLQWGWHDVHTVEVCDLWLTWICVHTGMSEIFWLQTHKPNSLFYLTIFFPSGWLCSWGQSNGAFQSIMETVRQYCPYLISWGITS